MIDDMDPIDLCLLTIAIIFLLFTLITTVRTEYLNVPIIGTVNPGIGPNYELQPGGTSPSTRAFKDPAEDMDYPYYEGPYGEIILPSNLGMYSQNMDYRDYDGIYP